MSSDTCSSMCRGPFLRCVLTMTYPANQYTDLKEDIDCYACVDASVCSDYGRLDAADCWPACEVNPKLECAADAPTASGTPCFKCVPKGQKPPLPGHTDRCEDAGYQTPPCSCGPYDYPINAKAGHLDCCLCLKDQCHPQLNVWECKECQAKGGTCCAMTRARNGPHCYGCRMPVKPPPQTCREIGRAHV